MKAALAEEGQACGRKAVGLAQSTEILSQTAEHVYYDMTALVMFVVLVTAWFFWSSLDFEQL